MEIEKIKLIKCPILNAWKIPTITAQYDKINQVLLSKGVKSKLVSYALSCTRRLLKSNIITQSYLFTTKKMCEHVRSIQGSFQKYTVNSVDIYIIFIAELP